MSEPKPVPAPQVRTRRLVVRSLLLVVYVLLVWVVFVLGKSHSLIVDNKDSADGSVSGIDGLLVSVDGREAQELYAGDRVMENVQGQRHRVSVEAFMEGTKLERSFTLPIDADMLLLSIPKLLAGQEPWIEIFVPRDQTPPPGEAVGNTNSFTSPDAEGVTASEETPPADAPPEPPPP